MKSNIICPDKKGGKLAFVSIFAVIGFIGLAGTPTSAQHSDSGTPVIVRPGAPGQPTQVLPPTTRGYLLPTSRKDVEFMQGMIMHHAQAVEMTDLIDSRTKNPDIRKLGSRISQSQADEMKFMERWLELRKDSIAMSLPGGKSSHGHGAVKSGSLQMPGMLSPEQMESLKKAKGTEFDRLFLTGMIQHHKGALAMVKDLFESAGSAQDGEIFNFATDVDSGQRAEIKTMETLLGQIP